MPRCYAEADRIGVGAPFGGCVGQDDKNPDAISLIVGQAGLGMPDRDYYLSNDRQAGRDRAPNISSI